MMISSNNNNVITTTGFGYSNDGMKISGGNAKRPRTGSISGRLR